MAEATPTSIMRAATAALKRISRDKALVGCAVSAGFVTPGDKEEQLQIFVRVSRFSPALLKDKPDTGGLLELNTGRQGGRK